MSDLNELLANARARNNEVNAQYAARMDEWMRSSYPELFTPEAEARRTAAYEAAGALAVEYQKHQLQEWFNVPIDVYLSATAAQRTALRQAAEHMRIRGLRRSTK